MMLNRTWESLFVPLYLFINLDTLLLFHLDYDSSILGNTNFELMIPEIVELWSFLWKAQGSNYHSHNLFCFYFFTVHILLFSLIPRSLFKLGECIIAHQLDYRVIILVIQLNFVGLYFKKSLNCIFSVKHKERPSRNERIIFYCDGI